ncbi:hypothetical protein C6I21_10075 [Alkalicoccus urumqiensis]|uniref:Uncharacterized protein n=2 Tax=Alkalicoccus urumqiensis TaxID=1548213 RepID=A0A2P6MGY1_ALKUR|nr:hypothetical protein C6I21_10075 [Alkalicoccus urumqiensis]
MFTLDTDGRFQLFVQDTYTGTSYRYLQDLYYELPDDYEVESYVVQLSEDTTFFNEGSSSEGFEEFPFHLPNQRVEIEVVAENLPVVTERETPVTNDSRLLPVVEAESITTSPYTSEDFLEVHTPVEDNHYMLFLFDESFNREYLNILQEFASQIGERYDTYLDVIYHQPEYFETYMDIDEKPSFLLLDDSGEALRTADWQEVIDWFQQETAVSFPREGDRAWYDVLYE